MVMKTLLKHLIFRVYRYRIIRNESSHATTKQRTRGMIIGLTFSVKVSIMDMPHCKPDLLWI